jgi:hypothetical protein
VSADSCIGYGHGRAIIVDGWGVTKVVTTVV